MRPKSVNTASVGTGLNSGESTLSLNRVAHFVVHRVAHSVVQRLLRDVMASGLTAEHFYVSREKTLCIRVPGPVLVFFKMMDCNSCQRFEPIFRQLATLNQQYLKLCIADVQQYPGIPRNAVYTSTPIKTVPMMLLYNEGQPLARFKGDLEGNSVQNFISKMLGEIRNRAAAPAGRGGMSQPTAGRGQGLYGAPASTGRKIYAPEMPSNAPNLAGVIKGGGAQFSPAGFNDEEDTKLLMPDNILPKNRPWDGEARKDW